MKSLQELKTKRFNCLQCGECCGAWNLPVEYELYEKLSSQDFVITSLKNLNCSFSQIEGDMYLPKKDGLCIFFSQETKLCIIQARYDPELKPKECRRFPFAYAETVDGKILADTSFYCKAIIKNEGEDIEALLHDDSINVFDKFKMPAHIFVTPSYSVTIQTGRTVIDSISDYIYSNCLKFSIESWDIPLIKGFSVLKQISENLVINGSLQDTSALNNLSFPGVKTVSLKRAFFTGLILRKNSSLVDFLKILTHKGEFHAPILADIIDLSVVDDIPIENSDETRELLLRYLLDIIDRKILLAHGHSIASMYMVLFAAYCLTLWYARALATMEGETRATLFHIELAIRITERYYIGHNIRFMELFRNSKSFAPLNKFMAG